MAIVLQKWERLISEALNPSKVNLDLLTDEDIHELIAQSEDEQESVRALLIEELLEKTKVADKQQFVQINQAFLIRLLDKVHLYKQSGELSKKIVSLLNTIILHLESALTFIEDFFGNYFDRNEKLPAPYLLVSLDELYKQLEKLNLILHLNDFINADLKKIIIDNFHRFCNGLTNNITYNELMYQKELMNELLDEKTLSSESSIKRVFFYFNFNNDDYVAYLYQTFTVITEPLSSKDEKIIALRFEQKNINQLITKLNYAFSPYMPSLKEQINQWIEEEIKFLEAENIPVKQVGSENSPDEKIHLSLSVAKIALLIRLMLLDKIITNRVVANVLRIVVKTFTTVQKENVSFGSLETKYHNPDRGTISAVKDMLFRWINILSKL